VTTTLDSLSRTIHLPTEAASAGSPASAPKARKGLHLNDLKPGETARILRVAMADAGCRKRFAELGLAEGMKVTVASSGGGNDTLMLIVGGGNGTRMGLAARCAQQILVSRIA
jgi:Fe2+ transport system protein FeoA